MTAEMKAFIWAMLVSLLFVVGYMDFEDQARQAAYYCKNVKEGVWPDYNGLYKDQCEENAPDFQKSL